GWPSGSGPDPLRGDREPEAAVALPARHGLRRAPPRRQLERLLRAAVGAGTPRLGRELCGAQALEELPPTVRQERRDQNEMRDGDQYAQEGDRPPFSKSGERAAHSLLAIERADRDAAGCRAPAVAVEKEGLDARGSGWHPHSTT